MDTWFPTFRKLAGVRPGLPTWFSPWPLYSTQGQQQSLLRLIAVATEENLPLIPLLEAWAADERGVQRLRLLRLIDLLKIGAPLPEAIDEIPGLLRDEDLLAIRFDAQMGTRTAAVRERLEEFEPAPTKPGPRIRNAMIYFCVVLGILVLLVTFNQLKIVPVLERMLTEFHIEQPDVLQWSKQLARTVANTWWLWALALVAVLWPMFSTRTGRFLRHTIFAPLFRPWRELYSAGVLQTLGIAMNAGRPIPGALSTLARYHFDPHIRHKLLFVRNEVELGAEVWQSMSKVGLLAVPEVRLLKAAERVGNRPWALKQLVGNKRRRAVRWLEQAAEFLLPALVVLLGVFVLFQSLTVFGPLTQIIKSLI